MDRCDMRQQRAVDLVAALAQCHHGAIQIDRIPEDDRRRDQVEAGGAMALPSKGPVADLAEPFEADGPSQIIAQLALVQDSTHSAPQLRVEQPVEHEQCSLDAPTRAARAPDRSDAGNCPAYALGPDDVSASLQSHYRTFNTTTSDSSTDLCLGILPHGFRPLVISLHITASDFPRSP